MAYFLPDQSEKTLLDAFDNFQACWFSAGGEEENRIFLDKITMRGKLF